VFPNKWRRDPNRKHDAATIHKIEEVCQELGFAPMAIADPIITNTPAMRKMTKLSVVKTCPFERYRTN
jgi:hypothetical protein